MSGPISVCFGRTAAAICGWAEVATPCVTEGAGLGELLSLPEKGWPVMSLVT